MKKLSTKQIVFFGLIGFLIFLTLNASAMMGGHGSGGKGGSKAEHMGGNKGAGGHDSYHYGSSHMDQAMAERLAYQYMENHSSGFYEMGEIRDEGSYYMTEIVRPESSAKERLRIDKRTGNIRSIR
jgi:hypothetical protein